MTMRWTWTAQDTATTAMIGMMTLTYLGYHYGLAADRFRGGLKARHGPDGGEIGSVLLQRILGGLLLGIVPAIAVWLALGVSPAAFGLALGNPLASVAWFCGLGIVLVPILRRAARQPAHRKYFPQMRLALWNGRRHGVNILAWGVYLLGYEYFFRGVMLGYFVNLNGIWTGIMLTTALYAFAHLPKGFGECFGSAVMGVVFGVMALHTGAIWAPFAVHWLIATCSEGFAVPANPALTRV